MATISSRIWGNAQARRSLSGHFPRYSPIYLFAFGSRQFSVKNACRVKRLLNSDNLIKSTLAKGSKFENFRALNVDV